MRTWERHDPDPFSERPTRIALSERHHQGPKIVTPPAGGAIPDDHDLRFVIRADGRLVPVTEHQRPAPEQGDTLVLLGPAPPGAAVLSRFFIAAAGGRATVHGDQPTRRSPGHSQIASTTS